jgi:transposase
MDTIKHERLVADPLGQPTGIRYFLWLGIGKALGLPVDAILEAITINLEAAKRERGQRPAPFTVHERMRLAALAVTIGKDLQSCFTWLAAPASLVRWLKRYQERQAQKATVPDPPRVGRPRASSEKVAAVLKIYHSGATGLKRIEGELRKCGLTLARSTIRRILDDHGLPPGENWTPGNTWRTFWRNHAPATIGIDFIQVAVGLCGKITYQFALIPHRHRTRYPPSTPSGADRPSPRLLAAQRRPLGHHGWRSLGRPEMLGP